MLTDEQLLDIESKARALLSHSHFGLSGDFNERRQALLKQFRRVTEPEVVLALIEIARKYDAYAHEQKMLEAQGGVV